MSDYKVEHNIPSNEPKPSHPPRRPDLSTFFSTLELVDTSDEQVHHNVHALPQPDQMAAVYRLLANAFEMMRGRASEGGEGNVLNGMVEILMESANDPPRELQGVPDSFLDELERVPKKSLKKTDVCPICCNPFLEDEYPLVVQLPCHKDHRFDLDCIRPWLKLNSTCPLDRKILLKRKEPPPQEKDDDDGEWDEMYA
ncbi:hypothetical protein K432DRAFT_411208 [Lepidopterella palustris CBS 459.81]|uniref:RING-type domain-containing protein n=1 Tax=Lepidopterella palustris CBS 459.81 TaxID=1314670 RepID=A0A8E2DWP4_9PEZI|nr:hypothetical protein K432DRAFT_411208 [Lepidopterella palustris CBS 459.81]